MSFRDLWGRWGTGISVVQNLCFYLISTDYWWPTDSFIGVTFLCGNGDYVRSIGCNNIVEFKSVGNVISCCSNWLNQTSKLFLCSLMHQGADRTAWRCSESSRSTKCCVSPKINIDIPGVESIQLSYIILHLKFELKFTNVIDSQWLSLSESDLFHQIPCFVLNLQRVTCWQVINYSTVGKDIWCVLICVCDNITRS